jgi:hypothetical protein
MDMKRSCHNHCNRFSDWKIEQMITGVNGNRIVCILRRAIGLMLLHIIEIFTTIRGAFFLRIPFMKYNFTYLL